ncbi:MAG TPA: alpha/beta fold hydrolase [Caulobacteraceae bacterium]
MRPTLAVLMSATLAAFACQAAQAQSSPPAAVIADPPADKAHPAAMAYVRVPSHGALMNGVMYTASGPGPHPTVLLFHGFPGNEQNLDLAQAMRRAGFNVLTFHYRGAWGSPGDFSFAHAIEDSDAALAYLRDPKTAARFGVDETRVFVAGHSMGGYMAASATARDPAVAGLIMISAWNIGPQSQAFHDPKARQRALDGEFAEDAIPLAGTSADALMDEAMNHPGWSFAALAPALGARPTLLVTANDGSFAASHELSQKLPHASEVHMDTDHPFSDHRIALETVVVNWLGRQASAAAP